jgi:hypothetical protein
LYWDVDDAEQGLGLERVGDAGILAQSADARKRAAADRYQGFPQLNLT